MIVTVLPAIVSVALRAVVEVFAAIEKPTVPFPEPGLPLVTVIHEALLAAVHEQPLVDVTPTDPVPLVAASESAAVESV